MATDAVNDFTAVLVDPEETGFYKCKAQQWATLCPHMSPTDHRVFALLVDLCSAKANVRRLTISEIAAMLPAGKAIAIGETPHSVSVSTIARSINALSEIGQITDRDGGQIRVSNKTRADIVIAPWKSLRHDCTASRNVYDALARVRGATGDDGPRYPVGLGTASNLVPGPEPAPNLVPAASNLVPTAPDMVPTDQETPEPTSENREESISPNSLPKDSTHTPGTPETDSAAEPKAAGVCVEPEQDTALIDTLVLNLVTRAPASKQTDDDDAKRAITAKAEECIAAGATVADIDAALSARIDRDTTHPINVGIKALGDLLKRLQGAQDPFAAVSGTTQTSTSSWIDDTGFEYPHLRADQRECGGRSCCDLGGKRYVSIVQPGLGAFSCPICKNHYKKEAATA